MCPGRFATITRGLRFDSPSGSMNRRLFSELNDVGVVISRRTVSRLLVQLGPQHRHLSRSVAGVVSKTGLQPSLSVSCLRHRFTHFEAHAREMPISAATCAIGRVVHRSVRRRRPSTDSGALA
ncbi:hypothetical protein ASD51_02495 [Streptomyces sp. Root55]|nr:hypothetical protein ASD26_12135 [Streptomyces sp. Root1319]KQZ21280.1 hypothetical protein ASD51_02495 [Streptomyces sp. Root55]